MIEQYATARQLEFYKAVKIHGSQKAAAEALKINLRTLTKSLATLKKKAALQGVAPDYDMTHPVPDGFKVKGVSSLYNHSGELKAQWIKSSVDQESINEALEEFAITLAESIKGLAPVSKAPAKTNEDILCVYPMGDPHFGLHAWWQETGNDFDLDIAEKLTMKIIDRLVSSAPKAKTAILLNLGDMFHADNQSNTTPKSGNQLDVDGRWAKVQQVGLRAMIYCIRRLLEKHEKVIIRINKGNHDINSSYALSLMIDAFFNNEPRVEVNLSPAICWYYRFGRVLLGSTHGDTIKGKDMIGIMAADKPEEWGKTKHRYWYVGHVHHQDVKEYPGGIVEYFRTVAARDAWHTEQGYRAGRDMCLIVMHKDHGEIERHRCDIGMLED